ncbi:hypothetical protein Glove_183g87 [Diversispora epigaea]|uniref:DUF6570 domain-containing protein n=1 Tax=Diversispora epigaea TaxID=1348612 RepID=A0A397IMM1_9GLOM|nr:hypothetical protein Glove_183g87 [Diversispora epigaea]
MHISAINRILIFVHSTSVDARVPLCILKLNNEFDLSRERYANWPQPINKTVANDALAEFRESIKCDSLRELCCTVCSGLYPCEHLSIISMQEIHLLLLEASKYIVEKSFLENDFVYKHPCMDESNRKVLLDRNGFFNNNISNRDENLFDIQVCSDCKQSLDKGNTPMFSLANMWIGTTPQCFQGLTIPEQLLISAGYICINIIQLTDQKYTHHKLKGHVITFLQEPTSLSTVLPLPIYRLCDYLKVIFIGQGRPSEEQLKKVLFNKTTLESLPENEVPVALLVTTVLININSKKVEHYTGYVTDPIDEDNINDDSSDIYDEELNNNKDTTKLYNSIGGLTELRSSELIGNKQIDSSHAILMPHSNISKNKYTDPTFLPAAFPTLFSYGIGGHEDNFRKQHISFK